VKHIVELFDQDKLYQAGRALEKLECETGQEEEKERKYLDQPKLLQIRSELGKLRQVERLRDGPEWEMSYDGATTKIMFQREVGSPNVLFKIQGSIRAEAMNIVCLLNEVDLYSTVIWFFQCAEVIERLGIIRRIVQCRAKLLWPLADREFVTHMSGIDGLDEDDCIVLLTVQDMSTEGGYAPSSQSKRREAVRANVDLTFFIQPVEPTCTQLTIIAKIDFKLPQVPNVFMHWFGKAFGRFVVHAIEVRANDLPESHRKRLGQDPVYSWFLPRIEQFWLSKGKLEEFRQGHVDHGSRVSEELDVHHEPPGLGKRIMLSLFRGTADTK